MPIKITEAMKVKTEPINARRKEYILRLFVTGILPNSVKAVLNIKAICEKYLNDRYELEIIDIYQQPDLALTEDILAVPVLVKKSPLPEVRMIGDLSNVEKVLNGLGINH
ncbi:MAG: circadian clock KaiB family protein [Lentimicrobiaceae bacterium]|jgi:circadian clock protein KaiB